MTVPVEATYDRVPEIRPESESGFTLIELVVYSALLLVVLTIVGGLFLSTTRTEGTVRSVTEATRASQLIVDSIQTGIRNSSDFTIRDIPGSDDQMLVAQTARSGATLEWVCSAWYFSAADGGSIHFRQQDTAVGIPTVSNLGAWTLLVAGVAAPEEDSTFETVGAGSLRMRFDVTAGENPPVEVTSTVASRASGPGDLTCS
ncbi:PilW family protein [Marisediminicola sp. LYQ134]|uniref:PilW family protein n=1 Tax=Marisediminicola sp. LYQ134 TaxID=3391061 RepID=UPI003983A7DB